MVRTRSQATHGTGRERILRAVVDVLAARGFAGATMQRIADVAGVDKALLHYHFRDRARLFAAVADDVGDRLFGVAGADVAGVTDPAEIADAGFGALWRVIVDQPEVYAAYLAILSAASSDAELRAAATRLRERYRALVQHGLDQASAGGWRLRTDPAGFRVGLIAGLDGLAVEFLDRGQTPELEVARRLFETTLIAQLERV